MGMLYISLLLLVVPSHSHNNSTVILGVLLLLDLFQDNFTLVFVS